MHFLIKQTSLVFYFPNRKIGGVSTLFVRLAAALSPQCNVYLADYSDGYMATHLPKNVRLITVDENPKFPPDAIYIFQAFLPWRFPFVKEISKTSRILFWCLHPKNFDSSIFNEHHDNPFASFSAKVFNKFTKRRQSKLSEFVKYLSTANAIIYQDRANVASTSRLLNVAINDAKYLPVPLPVVTEFRTKELSKDGITCAWIGRICDFKHTILAHVVSRLRKVADCVIPVRLLIIGSGDYLPLIIDAAKQVAHSNYQIEFLGEMDESDLPKFLASQVDFLFAMGTSALEGARVGVPVFVTDYSYRKIEGIYRFRYLFENSEPYFGEEITSSHFESESTLEQRIQDALTSFNTLSENSYRYWYNYFSLEKVIESFRLAVCETQATFGSLMELGYFTPDLLGYMLRSTILKMRPQLRSESIGFRYDC